MSATLLVRDAMRALVPPMPMTTADWFRSRFYTADGKAFDEYAVPWVTAPNGPCEAIDNPQYRRIWLQWAARMFKTTFGQGVQMKYADVDPCQMMFATADEGLCKTIFGRYWMMFANCPPLRNQVPHEKKRSKTHIRLRDCQVYGAWARGKSRLADKSIRVGHGNEIDKWEHLQTSTEGDPLPRFLKRGAEYVDAKFILESTPSERNRSRVEAGRLRSTNCKYWVPCPHCAKFQELVKGNGHEAPGIFWETPPGGRSDPDLALKTAYYVCRYCKGQIDDIHRPEMIYGGVWVPEGCEVDHDKAMEARSLEIGDHSWLRGEPLRNAEDYGSQISVFYAIFHGWGKIAADFLVASKRPHTLRQWINEDAAETWEVTRTKTLPEKLGERLERNDEHAVVPLQATYITIGVDRQSAEGGFFVFVVVAWGPSERAWLIDWGQAKTPDDLLQNVLLRGYRHADDGYAVNASIAFIDSGAETKLIYDFCKEKHAIFPCKGMNEAAIEPYRIVSIGMGASRAKTDTARAAIGQTLIHVNTDYWESELQARMDDRNPGDEGSLTLVKGAGSDYELCEQLLNGGPEEKTDSRGYGRLLWVKKDDGIPNDYRDALRYSMCAARVWVDDRGGSIPVRSTVPKAPPRAMVSAGEGRPDGRPWM